MRRRMGRRRTIRDDPVLFSRTRKSTKQAKRQEKKLRGVSLDSRLPMSFLSNSCEKNNLARLRTLIFICKVFELE